MENKINVAEILKDCPKGMELDCTLYENVEFDYIEQSPELAYPIHCITKTNGGYNALVFTHNGCNDRHPNAKCVIFPKGKTTWEGFQIPFKVGDKVTHNMGILMNIVHMYWDAECNVIRYDIQSPVDNNYKLKSMLAEHLQPYKEETMEERKYSDLRLDVDQDDKLATEATIDGNKITPPKNYLIGKITKVDNGMLVEFVQKQPKYPKTYVECAKILNCFSAAHIDGYKNELLDKFQELLICRDAYWKIGGEPDIQNNECYCLYYSITDEAILKQEGYLDANAVLTFPTKEIRNVFYKNFKDLIEECKDLL